MYESYWQKMGEETTIVIPGWQFMSYFSDATRLCWFLENDFANQIVRLHDVVGNAVTENLHIVVGTGSTQLYQAALYALSPDTDADPISSNGHAGCALGNINRKSLKCTTVYLFSNCIPCTSSRWALVKDEDVARKMTKYIEFNTIGVSKDSQLKATKVLKVVSDNSRRRNAGSSFFEFSRGFK
ncbi:hypothetical protein F3Y22_tig00013960pilonHSYRG00036 [Hibiscus syriacus]|uniref:Alliinase C-terminal domain-containing protein n=1 Tax=Hibiscus syriacus TaxID=106335 RepID=A0A6A3C277_HIBSY|nr:hypothetical protein F3Y22_tig00013960pilonHSYRG00036 [Hibiscus syriacus]